MKDSKDFKDIEKLLEQEGDKLPNEVSNEFTELELLLKAEGEKLVSDHFDDVALRVKNTTQENPLPVTPVKKSYKKTIIFASAIAASLLLVSAIAIPVTINIVNGGATPAESSVRIIVSAQTEEVNPAIKMLLKGTVITNNIDVHYDIDANGKTVPSTYVGYTNNSKMVLSAMKHYDDLNEVTPVNFTQKVFDYSRDCFLIENEQYNLSVSVSSKSDKYATYLSNNLKNTITEYGKKNNLKFSIKIEKGQINSQTTVVDSILSRVRQLFYEPKGGLDGYVPSKIEGKRFREDTWMEYLPLNDEEALNALNERLNKLPKFEREDEYMKLHRSLESIYGIYSGRKKSIQGKIKEIDNIVQTKYEEKVTSGDYKLDYDELPSAKWWKNEYASEEYDNDWAINFFKDVNLDFDQDDTYKNLKQRKSEYVTYLNDNQKWFSFSFEMVSQTQKPYDGDRPDDPIKDDDPWYGGPGFDNNPPSGDNWDDYWFTQYGDKGGKGPKN